VRDLTLLVTGPKLRIGSVSILCPRPAATLHDRVLPLKAHLVIYDAPEPAILWRSTSPVPSRSLHQKRQRTPSHTGSRSKASYSVKRRCPVVCEARQATWNMGHPMPLLLHA
jgi:hypothetical protein